MKRVHTKQNRRRVLASLVISAGTLAMPSLLFAQAAERIWRIGILNPRTQAAAPATVGRQCMLHSAFARPLLYG